MKVGHTGTLDPFATGLMILVIGKECKNAGNYSKLDKVLIFDLIKSFASSFISRHLNEDINIFSDGIFKSFS